MFIYHLNSHITQYRQYNHSTDNAITGQAMQSQDRLCNHRTGNAITGQTIQSQDRQCNHSTDNAINNVHSTNGVTPSFTYQPRSTFTSCDSNNALTVTCRELFSLRYAHAQILLQPCTHNCSFMHSQLLSHALTIAQSCTHYCSVMHPLLLFHALTISHRQRSG